MKSLRGTAVLLLLLPLALFAAQNEAPKRPKITGISHVSFLVADLAKADAFYSGYLGYEAASSDGKVARYKVNDRQTIEVVHAPGITAEADRGNSLALQVDDAEAMRVYLKSKGVDVSTRAEKDENGNLAVRAKDPQGNVLIFVQHLPDGRNARDAGKHLSDRAVSRRIMHAGLIIARLDVAKSFYEEILGFREFWRGTGGPVLAWVNVRIPDGEDYIEFMLYDKFPDIQRMRTYQHVCLEIPDADKSAAVLKTRTLPEGSPATGAVRTGINGRRQINTFDPDGTRSELMEPNTVDGKPRPSSTAPVPVGEARPAGR
jgi:catechol 2,3-dioxygenase-like lactoylglutathione lyase family enzyme